jgi:hypothetical protein
VSVSWKKQFAAVGCGGQGKLLMAVKVAGGTNSYQSPSNWFGTGPPGGGDAGGAD